MADRRVYDQFDRRDVHQPRNRGIDFEEELNKYCFATDITRYKICKDARGDYVVIGNGAFGRVYEAIDNDARRRVALKVMKKDHILANRFERRVLDEIRIHSRLMHPRIVEMYECFHDKKHVYIALELCPGGDLEHYLRRGLLSEEVAASIFRQVVDAVLYLHRVKTNRDGQIIGNPIIHRDLKPSNICFAKDNSVKICDFNLATEITNDGQKNTTYCGTPGYMPPEVAMNVPYSFEVDAYGLGCILYSMLLGGPPGKAVLGSSRYDVHIPDGVVSVDAENLLRNLLCKDGRQRMSVKAVAKEPFLMKHAQRKRLASFDSGFDTQHTGSSLPESSRTASSRERGVPHPAAGDVNIAQCVLPSRRPTPLLAVHPNHDDTTSARLQFLFPSSNIRPPSSHQSPGPSRAKRASFNFGHCNTGPSVDSGMPDIGIDDIAVSRKPRSPVRSRDVQELSQKSTPKVRYFSKMVQYAYMENGDFIARFSDGKVAMRKRHVDGLLVARDKKKADLTTLEAAHFQKVFRIVRALEQVCETECGANATCDCFPVILDKRQTSVHNGSGDLANRR